MQSQFSKENNVRNVFGAAAGATGVKGQGQVPSGRSPQTEFGCDDEDSHLLNEEDEASDQEVDEIDSEDQTS